MTVPLLTWICPAVQSVTRARAVIVFIRTDTHFTTAENPGSIIASNVNAWYTHTHLSQISVAFSGMKNNSPLLYVLSELDCELTEYEFCVM